MDDYESHPQQMRVLPCIGANPSGRWIGTGLARAMLVERLEITPDCACAAIGEHLGRTIPFKFADWTLLLAFVQQGRKEYPTECFGYRDSAPDIAPGNFRNLFFFGNEIDPNQWAMGIFGVSFQSPMKWQFIDERLGHVGVGSFTVKGTVIDEIALHRAFGIPCDSGVMDMPAIRASNRGSPVPTELSKPVRTQTGKYKGGNQDYDARIVAKIDALKGVGVDGRFAVRLMVKEPGFEKVSAVYADSLIKGRYKQGSGSSK